MVQERLDFCTPEEIRMTLAVEVDVLPGPIAVAFRGAGAEVATLADDGEAVEEAGRLVVAGGFITPLRSLLVMKKMQNRPDG